MKRDCRLYLDDIIDALNKIERYTEGLEFEAFRDDQKTLDAVIRNFTVLGEAAKKVPLEITEVYRDIP